MKLGGRHIPLSCCLAALAIYSPPVDAAAITIPAGLNPGGQYRLVFVTSTTRSATSTDIASYDATVAAAAASSPELNALGTNWRVIGSTAAVNAFDHIGGAFSMPLYNLGGLRVADNSTDLWDTSISNPIQFDEFGALTTASFVWTGTQENGSPRTETGIYGHARPSDFRANIADR